MPSSHSSLRQAAILRARAETAAAALPPLHLAAGPVIPMSVSGSHGLRRPGTGEDFWQYRPAHAGDTARAIDWRRSARSDAQFVRDRERQTMRIAEIWVGRGAGMGYAGQGHGGESKFDRARLIALALGLSMIRGGERVAMLGEPPGTGAVQAEKLSLSLAGSDLLVEDDDIPDQTVIQPGRIIVLINDFISDNNILFNIINSISSINCSGVILQVLHPDEEEFPFDGAIRFETAGGRFHDTRDAGGLRMAYRARLQEHREKLAVNAQRAGFVFGTHDLGRPVSEALIWLHGILSAR
ncbi:MAG: DUF58 domain-containing protein [Paracoccus sp. (in: a-proteobacteria)]